jgi:integrase
LCLVTNAAVSLRRARLLDGEDRTIYALAVYAGLRRGEALGLTWVDVDLGRGVIRVERGWDDGEGELPPKSESGRRVVPITVPLRGLLNDHRAPHGREGPIFARRPWSSRAPARARRAWQDAGLPVLTLHEARHTFASLALAAGWNVKVLSTFMGHGSITITLDTYAHLLDGAEAEAGAMLDAYLAAAGGPQGGPRVPDSLS